MWRGWNPYVLLIELQNGVATLENSLLAPQNVKHRVTMWPCNATSRYILKRNGYPHKILYTSIHNSTIYNSQTVETAQMVINWWVEKQNMIYPYDGILFCHMKGMNVDICYNIHEPWKHGKWKKKVEMQRKEGERDS